MQTGEEAMTKGLKEEVYWGGVWEGVAKKHISNVFWKFQRHYEFNDLVQEAWIVFNNCYKKYIENEDSGVVEAKHAMALYKTSLHRHFNRLALNLMEDATHHPLDTVFRDEEGQEPQSALEKIQETGKVHNTLIQDTLNLSPDQIVALLNLPKPCLKFLEAHLTDEGIKVLRQGSMFKRSRNAKRGDLFPRETSAEFYRRVAGVDASDINIREEIKKALEK